MWSCRPNGSGSVATDCGADVAVGTEVGTEITAWLDSTGAVATAPRSDSDSAALGGVAGLSLVMGGWLVLYGLLLLARRPLNRRRAEHWEREWERVSSHWKRNQR